MVSSLGNPVWDESAKENLGEASFVLSCAAQLYCSNIDIKTPSNSDNKNEHLLVVRN